MKTLEDYIIEKIEKLERENESLKAENNGLRERLELQQNSVDFTNKLLDEIADGNIKAIEYNYSKTIDISIDASELNPEDLFIYNTIRVAIDEHLNNELKRDDKDE